MKKLAALTFFVLTFFYPLPIFAVFSVQVVENVKSAVVALYKDENLNYFRGSGFFIDSSGIVITAEHVVKNYPRLWALLYDGRKLELISAGFQENDDLALMLPKINETSVFPYLKFSDINNLTVGQSVMAIGSNSFGGLWQILYGNIKNLHKKIILNNLVPKKELNSTIEYSVLTPMGFSGSPLVDENGNVLGINIGMSDSGEDLSYAMGLLEIKSFIEKFYLLTKKAVKYRP